MTSAESRPLPKVSIERGTVSALSVENNFDLIRLFAASEVALKHTLEHLGMHSRLTEALGILPGVPIFFFVSGYLIFQSFAKSRSLTGFFTNRVLRIYPALVACFGVSVALVLATGYLAPDTLLSMPFAAWTMAQLSILQFYNPDFLRGFGVGVINGSLWTITVELQFYLLAPVLFYLVAGRRWLWLTLILAFMVPNVLLHALWDDGFLSKLAMVTFVPWWYMFILGAWLSTRPDVVARICAIPLPHFLLAFAAAFALALSLGVHSGENAINPVSFLIVAGLVLKLAFTAPQLANAVLGRNDISYGVYIYHMVVVNGLVYYGLTGRPAYVAAAMACTYGLAALSWFLVEKPALGLKRMALRRY